MFFCPSQRLVAVSVLFCFSAVAPAATKMVPSSLDPVAAGQALQSAINAAAPGDTILVAAGGQFEGPISLPAKNNPSGAFITIRSSAPDGSLPAAGQRIDPSYSPVLPKILADRGYPAVATDPGASYYNLMGLEFVPAGPTAVFYQILQLGGAGSSQSNLSQVPQNLVVDRCYLHGFPNVDSKTGIQLNSGKTDIKNSFISEIHSQVQDSSGITGYNGPGPYNIVNNYIEASGVNILFGGAVPSIPNLVPSNINVLRNDFAKQLSYKNWDKVDAATYQYYQQKDPTRLARTYYGSLVRNFIIHTPGAYTPTVKNMFELKSGQDVVLQGNTFTNNWVQGDQNGTPILLKPNTNSGQSPWSVVQRISISNNVVRHTGGAIAMLPPDVGQTSPATNNVSVVNNLFDDIRDDYAFDYPREIQASNITNLTFDHNTYLSNYFYLFFYGAASTNVTYTNNITAYGNGFSSECGFNIGAFNCNFVGAPPYTFTGNVVIGGPASAFPNGASTFLPSSVAGVGFVNAANLGGDYHNYALSSASPYKGRGTNGSDPGFNPASFDADRGAGSSGGTGGSGGSLTGTGTSGPGSANLTAEGSADWIHWGDSSLIRKASVGPQLSTFATVGNGSPTSYGNDQRPLSWSDGTPTASSGANTRGVFISGVGNGFSFTAPADTTSRTLTVHVGGWNSAGTLTAHLSDGSAADFTETTPSAGGQYDRNYTLTYSAASAGKTITVTWVAASGSGNVTLNGAGLK